MNEEVIRVQHELYYYFLGLLPSSSVATIGKDGLFSLAQLSEDTLLIVIDEWSETFLGEDTLKRLLQGVYLICFCQLSIEDQR